MVLAALQKPAVKSVSLFVILSRNSPRDAGMNFQFLPGLMTEAVLTRMPTSYSISEAV